MDAWITPKDLDDPRLRRRIAEATPLAYQAFFGRTYVLPNSRQADYTSQKFQNTVDWDRICTFAANKEPPLDETWRVSLSNVVAALHYNRRTLFLERELGEALFRTDILDSMNTSDIRWRWPAFRIYLPVGLITVERENDSRWATYFDISEIDRDSGHTCPLPLARELDRFCGSNRLQTTKFLYKENGLCISTALNEPDSGAGIVQTTYSQLKPWGNLSITKFFAIKDTLAGGTNQDEADRNFLRKLEHLVINVLLFMSAKPDEDQLTSIVEEQPLRSANFNPSKLQSELARARFVGELYPQLALRAHSRGTATGRHTIAHWVAGHWKRIPYGKGLALRRLQWIQPYTTHDENVQ